MRHFERIPEPVEFNAEVRTPGGKWLEEHVDSRVRPRDFWNNPTIISALAKGFDNLCAYSLIHQRGSGTVDHFMSVKNRRDLAYEWTNYRYCDWKINGRKQNADDRILDPFEVEDDWFEISVPGFLLVPTQNIPIDLREKADYTIERLQLDHDNLVEQRQRWYAYLNKFGEALLTIVEEECPLVARAWRIHNL